MRKLLSGRVEAGRLHGTEWSLPSGPGGVFAFMGPCGTQLRVVSSPAEGDPRAQGFEHVSVSTPHRIPNWEEMSFVKEAFWRDDETVYQLHPAKSEYVNNHPHVLHLWRNIERDPPLPPLIFVGVKGETYANAEEAADGMRRARERGELE